MSVVCLVYDYFNHTSSVYCTLMMMVSTENLTKGFLFMEFIEHVTYLKNIDIFLIVLNENPDT